MAILKIIQHNVLSWTFLRRNELSNIYLEDSDIILINAHGRSDHQIIKIYEYQTYQKNQTNGIHNGVAIAIKNNIKRKIIDDLDESYLVCIVTQICLTYVWEPATNHHEDRPYLWKTSGLY